MGIVVRGGPGGGRSDLKRQLFYGPHHVGVGLGGNGGVDNTNGNAGERLAALPEAPMPYDAIRRMFGGGGGGAAGGGGGGAGGRGGGVIYIEAENIVWGGSGIISSKGDDGVVAGAPSQGGGGGGGGCVHLMYGKKTGSSTITVTGGVGGNGTGKDGGAGADGIKGEFEV